MAFTKGFKKGDRVFEVRLWSGNVLGNNGDCIWVVRPLVVTAAGKKRLYATSIDGECVRYEFSTDRALFALQSEAVAAAKQSKEGEARRQGNLRCSEISYGRLLPQYQPQAAHEIETLRAMRVVNKVFYSENGIVDSDAVLVGELPVDREVVE